MTETGSSGQFKAVQELMHEMVAMWQRVKDLEEADRDHRQEIEALRASDARLRCVVEKLPLRFFFKDSGLNYILCSEAYARDWEMKPGELGGKSDRDLFSADVVEKLAAVEYEVIQTGKMEIAEEDRLVAGREITVLAIRKPIINGTGDTLGLLCVLWDITEDKRLKVSQERRIHELEGALSERVGQVESLRNEMEAASVRAPAEGRGVQPPALRTRGRDHGTEGRNPGHDGGLRPARGRVHAAAHRDGNRCPGPRRGDPSLEKRAAERDVRAGPGPGGPEKIRRPLPGPARVRAEDRRRPVRADSPRAWPEPPRERIHRKIKRQGSKDPASLLFPVFPLAARSCFLIHDQDHRRLEVRSRGAQAEVDHLIARLDRREGHQIASAP